MATTTNSTLNWGLIGPGRFGKIHASVINSLPASKLHSICGRTLDSTANTARELNVPFSTDFRELIQNPEIDIISVVTHWQEHYEIAKEVLSAGKHLFLEKPMAASSEQCDELVALAEKSNAYLMVGHICRFDPRVVSAYQSIQNGEIGRILSMHAKRNLPKAPGNIRLNKISPLMGDGIHDADLMMWFLAKAPASVYAKNIRASDEFTYPDLGWAMLHFDDDAIGVVETVWCLPENVPTTIDAKFEVIGTEGTLSIDCANTGFTILNQNGQKKPDTVYWPEIYGERRGTLGAELDYFATCVRNQTPPTIITPREAARAVRVMEKAEESARAGLPISL